MDDTHQTEGELVDPQTSATDANSDAIILLNLESLVKGHISSLEKLQIEVRKHKEMLDSALANDPTYKEHSEKAKEANQIKSQTRAQIMKQPSMMTLSNKMKNFKSEARELQIELSEYLQEYQRLSGTNEIEGEDGTLREIVNEAKLIKKSSKR